MYLELQEIGDNLKNVRANVLKICERDSWNVGATYSCFENASNDNPDQPQGNRSQEKLNRTIVM